MTDARNPPGDWERLSPSEPEDFSHSDCGKIDIGETNGGFYRVDLVTNRTREILGSADTYDEAVSVAFEYMRRKS